VFLDELGKGLQMGLAPVAPLAGARLPRLLPGHPYHERADERSEQQIARRRRRGVFTIDRPAKGIQITAILAGRMACRIVEDRMPGVDLLLQPSDERRGERDDEAVDVVAETKAVHA